MGFWWGAGTKRWKNNCFDKFKALTRSSRRRNWTTTYTDTPLPTCMSYHRKWRENKGYNQECFSDYTDTDCKIKISSLHIQTCSKISTGKIINTCSKSFPECTCVITLSNDLKSYSFTISESTPAANIRPSGSKAATGLPFTCINPLIKQAKVNQRVFLIDLLMINKMNMSLLIACIKWIKDN